MSSRSSDPTFVPSTGPEPLELARRLFGPEPASPQLGDPGWTCMLCSGCGVPIAVRITSTTPAVCRACVHRKARPKPALAAAGRTLERLERALHDSARLLRQLLARGNGDQGWMVDDGTCDPCVRGNCPRCAEPIEWGTTDQGIALTCCCNQGYHLGIVAPDEGELA